MGSFDGLEKKVVELACVQCLHMRPLSICSVKLVTIDRFLKRSSLSIDFAINITMSSTIPTLSVLDPWCTSGLCGLRANIVSSKVLYTTHRTLRTF